MRVGGGERGVSHFNVSHYRGVKVDIKPFVAYFGVVNVSTFTWSEILLVSNLNLSKICNIECLFYHNNKISKGSMFLL